MFLLKAILAFTVLVLAVAGLLLALLALAFVVLLFACLAAVAVLVGLVIAVLAGAIDQPAAPATYVSRQGPVRSGRAEP
jgi:hypothetical protein